MCVLLSFIFIIFIQIIFKFQFLILLHHRSFFFSFFSSFVNLLLICQTFSTRILPPLKFFNWRMFILLLAIEEKLLMGSYILKCLHSIFYSLYNLIRMVFVLFFFSSWLMVNNVILFSILSAQVFSFFHFFSWIFGIVIHQLKLLRDHEWCSAKRTAGDVVNTLFAKFMFAWQCFWDSDIFVANSALSFF